MKSKKDWIKLKENECYKKWRNENVEKKMKRKSLERNEKEIKVNEMDNHIEEGKKNLEKWNIQENNERKI